MRTWGLIALAAATAADLVTTARFKRAGVYEANWYRWLGTWPAFFARVGVSALLAYLAVAVYDDPAAMFIAAACFGAVAVWNEVMRARALRLARESSV